MLDIDAPQGEVTSLKFRKEGRGENGIVPLDVSIKMQCPGRGALTFLLGSEAASFWRGNQDADLMYPYLAQCECTSKVEYAELSVGGVALKNSTLTKFKFKVLGGGMIELGFNCAVHEISEHSVALLRDLLQKPSRIKVDGGDLVDKANNSDDEEDDDQEEMEV